MDLERRLGAVAKLAIAEKRIVGTVLMVRQGGTSLYQKPHGLADRESGRAMTLDSVFRLSSLTKPIVSATVLAMVDDGKIRLDDLVTNYLPSFRPKLDDGTSPSITIHHLLTHTSGLSSADIVDKSEVAAGVNRWHLPTDEIISRMARLPLLFAPGTGWSYGPGIDVLGLIAGNLVGGTLQDAVRHYIADPLNMTDTGFVARDPQRLATPYADGPDGAVLMSDPHHVPNKWGGVTTFDPGRVFDPEAFQSGGGGMVGSAGDFMTFLEMLRRGGDGILQQQSVELGLSNRTGQLAYAQSPGWQFGYFGAWLDDPIAADTPAARGTNRWGGIYGHNWFIDPINELTVLSMSNTGLEGSDGAYVAEVRDAVYASL